MVGDAKLKANREKLIGMTTAQMRERHASMKEQLAGYLRMIDDQLAGKDFFLARASRWRMRRSTIAVFLALNRRIFRW